MSNAVLTLRHVKRSYEQAGRTLTVLRDVSLVIKAGEVVALLGPSGSGKTTLLQIAGLLDRPSSGDVSIGEDVMTSAPDRMRTQARMNHIGFVYQYHHLLREFTALENVVLPQMIAGKSEAQAESRAKELLAQFGLSDRLQHRPAKLSGGEQQRVAIARAMANRPQLLLADEPTGNLDPHTAEHVFKSLMTVAREQKVAVLVATHNVDLSRRMDRTVWLEDGVLKQ
ncbi:MAG: ABC transporter ATP-binding protein [Rickettsiales bacterium]|nr:ABC transporter ATP-binding protein [Rickettsiales bacterium]